MLLVKVNFILKKTPMVPFHPHLNSIYRPQQSVTEQHFKSVFIPRLYFCCISIFVSANCKIP